MGMLIGDRAEVGFMVDDPKPRASQETHGPGFRLVLSAES